MTTLELEATKAEVARQILDIDNWALLNKVRNLLAREHDPRPDDLTPYTLDQINAWLDESEADADAGREYTSEEMHRIIEEKFPELREKPRRKKH